ncbi:hypothetical protein [Pleurocapsa sp. FMAR1]|uniref:hypothetical protein n=1 Tax=Pleurocapsa sp. FMAR1 TaxID=3040204 RepID=UPI0029C92813|nr:hypothetical protein [Pleurocapsa sp. FMAR1]
MEQYLSAAEVAKAVGVHYRTIENWAAQEYLERDEGKYGLISALRHRIAQLEDEVMGLKDNPKAELQLQKLKEEVAERRAIARIKNMKADLLEGKLVDAGEVLDLWKNAIANTKAKFINLPAKLALELSGMDKPEDIQARLAQVINEALVELGGED